MFSTKRLFVYLLKVSAKEFQPREKQKWNHSLHITYFDQPLIKSSFTCIPLINFSLILPLIVFPESQHAAAAQ